MPLYGILSFYLCIVNKKKNEYGRKNHEKNKENGFAFSYRSYC